MIIAVDADFGGVGFSIKQPFFAGENFFFGGKDFFRFGTKIFREFVDGFCKQSENAANQSAHVLVNRALGHGVERLGRKRAVVLSGSERAMQLGGALSKQFRFLGINAADELIEKRTWRRDLILQVSLSAKDPFVITSDGIERQCPRVALGGDCSL